MVGIADGDTITLLDATSTEFAYPAVIARRRPSPLGALKAVPSELVYGRTVIVETTKRDRYGRVIGKVLLDGRDANLEQIQRGCGWHYKRYMNEQRLDDGVSLQRCGRIGPGGSSGAMESPRSDTAMGVEEDSSEMKSLKPPANSLADALAPPQHRAKSPWLSISLRASSEGGTLGARGRQEWTNLSPGQQQRPYQLRANV